ncbi:amidohydrolase [Conexibacter sp. JD483]|uniref:amidohydrolase family protein n=1 Tax=unclassified Conexibacter TaxID=2627773 RepID=UPI00271706CB|nr:MULTISPECIES: amidohydrolase [unclassified Conexibacter]MDO8189351.1 amidohydrolase [Conexibacter sp. CPCC 205706]MDO8200277.1 amidohydrolase [Conexibacter sp. CPCC 205762]MDR9372758.1 amidohydrolase [Conexibacter sp. JD483]
MSERTTVVRGAWLLAMDPARELLRDGAVAFGSDGAIAAVGPWPELQARFPAAAVVGDGNGLVLPGFVNAHTHLTEGLIAGMGETASLWEWFDRVVSPAAMVTTREDVRVGAKLKGAEMLLSGITTVNDMSCHRNIGGLGSLGAADGLAELGLRGIVSFGAENLYDGAPAEDRFMAEHEALADRLAGEPLLGFRLGIGTVLGVSEELMTRSVAACREHGWAVHTHLAEVREELTESRHLNAGRTTIEQSQHVGLLDCETIAGHCIWCGEADLSLLAARDVAVAHSPVANMLLGSGVAPVPRLLREGVRVGVATDGAASNDSQDMFGVLKSAALLQKVHHLRADAITAVEVVRMATLGGARALRLDHLVGSLEPGKRADVVLLDGDTPELATIHDPWQQLVYCATPRCVSDVWVDGARRVAGGRLVGHELRALAGEARALATDLIERAGMHGESVLAGGRGRAFDGAASAPSR